MAAAEPRTGGTVVARDAPVRSFAELEIDTPVDSVWDVLTAIDEWPTWNPHVKAASLHGPVAAGSTFRWKAGPGTISSIIEHVEPPRVIAWSGTTLGIRAIHVWRLQPVDGRTRASTEESYEGLVARVLSRPLQRTLDKALADGLRHLKAEAERTHGTTAPSDTTTRGSLP
jgi:uncharacterized protein YndB with AHSA1/START domain